MIPFALKTAFRTALRTAFTACVLASVAGAQPWPTAKPADVGVSQAVLDSIDGEVRAGRYGFVDRFLVIRRGRLVYDKAYPHDYVAAYDSLARIKGPLNAHHPTGPYNYYAAWWHPFYRKGDLHTLQSVTKTVTSVVIGTAVTRGEFPSIDTPIITFLDTTKIRNLDDRKRRITIRHLLTMSDGMEWLENLPYTDPRNTTVVMEGSYDWLAVATDAPMAADPGTRWNYNSGASQLLAEIFVKATRTDIEEYASRHLFAPLGIERWYWKRTPAGIVDTEGGLYLEAKDLARIWQLWLRDGMWNGRRVVSSDWVKASVAPAMSVAPNPAAPKYGYKWWLYQHPKDSTFTVWSGSGFGGQFPMALPKEDLVVVVNQWNLPGRQGMPRARVLARIVAGLTN